MVSHGSCEECGRFFGTNSKNVPIKEFIESFSFPILRVNANVVILDANEHALKFLGKGHDEISGRLGGDVIDCVNSQLLGGCGQTLCCTSCVIRRSVTETHKTGTQFIDVETFPILSAGTGVKKIHVKISTVRRSGSVLLKIVPI